MDIIEQLNADIAAVCPIHGVKIGIKTDKLTWRIDFKDEANQEQRDAAQAILNAFDVAAAEVIKARIEARKAAAKTTAKNIPNWATWTPAQWTTFFNANLADAQVDLITNIATTKVMMKRQNAVIDAMAKMLMAVRDELYPDLPE